MRSLGLGIVMGAFVLVTAACGSDDSAGNPSGSGGNGGKSGSGGGLQLGGSTGKGGSTGSGGAPGPWKLPAGFTGTEFGGYKLGDPFNGDTPPNVGGAAGAGGSSCGSTILAVVRDFKGANEPGGHPDFESFSGKKPTLGLVPNDLPADQKPGYTGICEATTTGNCPYGQQTTSKTDFDQWYRFAQDVNKPYVLYLSLQPNGNVITFQSDFFFPLDNAGWGNSGTAQDKKQHNFHFTTEVHTEFKYNGGEQFTFIGDDDVWVFINGKLAVDLGGLHPQATGTIDLDSSAAMLGITTGNTYKLDLFHAERHTNASHFRVDTNLQFTNCGTIVPEQPA